MNAMKFRSVFRSLIAGLLGCTALSRSKNSFPWFSFRDAEPSNLPHPFRKGLGFFQVIGKAKSYRTLTTPALFLNGSLDGAIPMAPARASAQKICRGPCLFVEVENGGHSGTNLANECINESLKLFIEDKIDETSGTVDHDAKCQIHSGVTAERIAPMTPAPL